MFPFDGEAARQSMALGIGRTLRRVFPDVRKIIGWHARVSSSLRLIRKFRKPSQGRNIWYLPGSLHKMVIQWSGITMGVHIF